MKKESKSNDTNLPVGIKDIHPDTLANKETFPAFQKEFTDYLINELKMPENKQQEIQCIFG